jgi:hypothetical protein
MPKKMWSNQLVQPRFFFVKQRFNLLAVSDITHYVLALFRTQILRIIHD